VAEYIEPTNEQLASFLAVYAAQLPAFQLVRLSEGELNPEVLEFLLERRPDFREAGLRHHRAFCEQIDELSRKTEAGELQCMYIRPNGKQCPNHNEPGRLYCGLHKGEEE
jgi:hypothetical protein